MKKLNIRKMQMKMTFIIEFVASILLMISIKEMIMSGTIKEHIRYRYIILCVFSGIVFATCLVYLIKRNIKKLERIFLITIIPVGIFYLVFVMPNWSVDEEEHIYRAYNISKGKIIAEVDERGIAKTEVPTYLIENDRVNIGNYFTLKQALHKKTNYGSEISVFNSAQGYSPTLYITTSIIFKLARCINLNFTKAIYIAKFINFLIFVLLGYYSIKLLPFGKLLMFTYLFNPMMIYQAVSLSADSAINSIILFFSAYVIKLLNTKEEINFRDKIIIAISVVLVSLAKYIYFPVVALLLLLLRKKNFKKKDKIFIIVICSVGLILALGWYIVSSRYTDIREYVIQTGVNSTEQIKFILKYPFKYFKVVISTLYKYGENVFMGFFGHMLGCKGVFTSIPDIFLYGIALIMSIFFCEENEELNKLDRRTILGISLILCILVFTGLYLIWSGVGADYIEGIQGRYFIPIMILPLMCCIRKEKYIKCNFNKVCVIYALIMIIINIQAIIPLIEISIKD